ncbi:trypsin-like serine peptidase [Stackebrandtia sp.]|uniref:trypsin-like serine peptidase n=1 Tax=Stackebrandtia sp. TaxID=2023065 RepID=UPI0039C91E9B
MRLTTDADRPTSRRRTIRRLSAISALAFTAAVALTATAASASAATTDHGSITYSHSAHHHTKATPSFAGTVALSNCSGSLVAMPNSKDSDPALVMSNGHCLEDGMPGPGEVITDKPSDRTFDLLNDSGDSAGTLTASKIAYATMTDTDVSIYQLTQTYAEIKDKYSIDALKVSADHPTQGAAITVVSGYWKEKYSCSIDGFVHELHEADWVWKDSVRYTPECETKGGTSGSPVISDDSGQLVAINNTGNEDGEQCTLNNPCEVDENGNTTVHKGTNYAEETYIIPACVDAGNVVNTDLPGCTLPKP